MREGVKASSRIESRQPINDRERKLWASFFFFFLNYLVSNRPSSLSLFAFSPHFPIAYLFPLMILNIMMMMMLPV